MSFECLDCGRVNECEHIAVKGNHVYVHITPSIPKFPRTIAVSSSRRSGKSQVVETFNRAMNEIVRTQEKREQAIRDAFRQVQQVVQKATRATQDDFALAPPQPADPRERALWAKEHRNTGPTKDQYEHRGQR